MGLDYSDIGLGSNLFKQTQGGLDKIDPDTQIEDGSVQGIKLMTKSVSLDKLYGQDLVVGGGSNISGSILVNDTANISRITLDATNGINVSSNSGSVFSTDISGTNTGNVTLGNYSGNKGLKYTALTDSLDIKGTITASVINGGTITGGTITGGTISGTTISASTISGNSITGGSISGSTISGGSVSGTTVTGSGLVIDQSTDSGGSTSAFLRWSGGSRIWSDTNNNMGINSVGTGGMFIYTNSTQKMFISGSNTNIYSSQVFLHQINFNFDGQGEGNIVNVDVIKGANDLRFQINGDGQRFKFLTTGGSDEMEVSLPQSGKTYTSLLMNGKEMYVDSGGTKHAIVPTSKGYRALYTNESPDVWFNDFCAGKKIFRHQGWKFWKWGFDWEAKPDSMFMEITVAPYVIIPTATKGLVQVWGKRKGHENKRFEEKTEEEFRKNEEFLKMSEIDKKAE